MMGLSKKELDLNTEAVPFDPEALGRILGEEFPWLILVFLLGSSQGGVVKPGSDLDLALLTDPSAGKPDCFGVMERAGSLVPGVRIDAGLLNRTEPVYRFEALKARMIFCRDPEVYRDFYSLTCREYEDRMIRYKRQRAYRKEALSVSGP
jgi:hypothetical protein